MKKFKVNTGIPEEIFVKMQEEDFERLYGCIVAGQEAYIAIVKGLDLIRSQLKDVVFDQTHMINVTTKASFVNKDGKYVIGVLAEDTYKKILDLTKMIQSLIDAKKRIKPYSKQDVLKALKANAFLGLLNDDAILTIKSVGGILTYFFDKKQVHFTEKQSFALQNCEGVYDIIKKLMPALNPIELFVKDYVKREKLKLKVTKHQELQAQNSQNNEEKDSKQSETKNLSTVLTREERIAQMGRTLTLCEIMMSDCKIAIEKGLDFGPAQKAVQRIEDRLFLNPKLNPYNYLEIESGLYKTDDNGFYVINPNISDKDLKTFEENIKKARHDADIVQESFYDKNVPEFLFEK